MQLYPEMLGTFLILAIALIIALYWLIQRSQSRPRRPSGRFNYSEGRYRRRLLAQSRRDYPGQSESWHLRRVEKLLQEKKKQW